MKKVTKRDFMTDEFMPGYVEARCEDKSAEFTLARNGDCVGAWFSLYSTNKKHLERDFKNYMKGLDTLTKHLAIHREHVLAVYDEYMDSLADKGKDGETFNAEKWKLENL